MQHQPFTYNQPFALECGETLPALQISYCTYGALNAERNNVIWVCHALTANADVADWWPDMVGKGLVFDTNKYLVVCANVLASCYGTTGPESINPDTSLAYADTFPQVTVRDMVKAHQLLAQHLNIAGIELLCGGSLGGQQACEWAIMQPQLIKQLFLVATNAKHSAWGIAFNETQRMALEGGENGLEVARAIAMLSYRHYNTYHNTQTDEEEKLSDYRAASYQRYQGLKLKKRFNSHSYHLLSKAMDAHNVGRGRSGVINALQQITANTLVIGINTDILFPVSEQKFLADNIHNATLEIIESDYGHDGFLIETKQITALLKKHLLI